MRVMKFGGTSVGNAESIRNVCTIIRDALEEKPIVVVSAVAGTTNSLIELANEISAEKRLQKLDAIRRTHEDIMCGLMLDLALIDIEFKHLEVFAESRKKMNGKTLDHLVSYGELLSAIIVAAALQKEGISAKAFPAWEIGMITNDHFGAAEPLPSSTQIIKRKIKSLKVVPVITGFIGKNRRGEITTLDRGGSDYTAAIIGAAIKADVIQIWKDVDGFMTTDPRLVPEAKVVPELSFEEASELAYFGAKVLHPRTILPAMKAGVPVQILNTFNPAGKGTTIVANFKSRRQISNTVEALTFKKNSIAVHVKSPAFYDGNALMARVFDIFDRYNTNVDLVTISVASVSVIISNDQCLKKIVAELSSIGEVTVERGKATLCAVGGSLNAAGVVGRMFTVLGVNKISVEMISQASSGCSITFVVNEYDAEKALKVLHKEYIG